jgi:hypothetical protein
MRILLYVVLILAFLTIVILVVGGDLSGISLNASSGFGPDLGYFNGSILIAWTTKYEIRIAEYAPGPSPKLTKDHGLGEYSLHAPALEVFKNRLYIAWTGTDKYALLNVKSSQDGETFDHKSTLPEDSANGPALAVFNNRLYLASLVSKL